MKFHKLTTAAAIFAAALATSAQAQVYPTVNSGDLLIGFEQQGNANDYVVDLGSVTQFIDAKTPVTFQLSTGDLTTAFTSSWASNSNGTTNVQWGVIGNDQSDSISSDPDGSSIWFTKGESTPGTLTSAPIRLSSSGLNAISNQIANLNVTIGNTAATTNTQSSTNLGVILTASSSDSWSYFKPGTYSGGTAFGIGSEIEQPSAGNNTGPTDSVLDLYEDDTKTASNQAATFLGTFNLSSGGVLTFDGAQAVPEPSAYALGFTAALLFFVLKRRNSIAAKA